MSTLFVNKIQASTGTTVLIPAGHSLQIGSRSLDKNKVLPSTSGQDGKLVYSDGTGFVYSDYGAGNIIVFTQSGQYVPSAGTKIVYVRLVGGGGGGTSYSETGGAAGYCEGFINLEDNNINSVAVTVGTGGSGTTYAGAAGTGGTTSFGSFMTAGGGSGANQAARHSGGPGGVGSGGMLSIYGGGGAGHGRYNSKGGGSYFGGGGPGGHPNGGRYSINNEENAAPGGGGASGWARSHGGAKGSNGIVVIMEYM